MTGGSVQRYKLSSNDTIKLNQSTGTPVLEIGQYQFELPKGQELNSFVSQWQQAGTQMQQITNQSNQNV